MNSRRADEIRDDDIINVLSEFVLEPIARGVLRTAQSELQASKNRLRLGNMPQNLVDAIIKGGRFFMDSKTHTACRTRLMALDKNSRSTAKNFRSKNSHPKNLQHNGSSPVEVKILNEDDIVVARNEARNAARTIGLSITDQTKVATSVSELARNIVKYANNGKIKISLVNNHKGHGIRVEASDRGGGIANLEEILSGNYRSKTGLGLGILGCKRIMDEFNIVCTPGLGTTITVHKYQ